MMDEGFDRWYRREHSRVLAVLAAMSGDIDAAREATDEAFVRALERWTRVEAMASPGAWVHIVALNCLRRSLRRAAVERRLLGRHRGASLTWDDEPDPGLWALVRQLPPRQRTAVVLRYVGDMTEPDIAQVMKVTRGAVAATLSEARAVLASALGREPVSKEARHG
jgi:RNA polymerase sigma-70 factor (ECF subfamily)